MIGGTGVTARHYYAGPQSVNLSLDTEGGGTEVMDGIRWADDGAVTAL